MNARPRRLVVLRHAQAEPTAASDADRPLTAGGLAAARAAGEWLGGLGVRVAPPGGVALVSAALRTRQTYDAAAAAAGWEGSATHDPGLYSAGPDAALDLVRAVERDVADLVLVGHNPTMGYLAQLLDDGEGDQEATTALVTRGYPPCAAAVFRVDGPWVGLGPGGARLEAFHVARG